MTEEEAVSRMHRLYYGLGVRSEGGEGYRVLEDDAAAQLAENETVGAMLELPPEVAYEVAYGLAMYGKTLAEYSNEPDAEQDGDADVFTSRSEFILEFAGMLHDLAQKGFALLGRDAWPEIDTSPLFEPAEEVVSETAEAPSEPTEA